eukprot:350382_1
MVLPEVFLVIFGCLYTLGVVVITLIYYHHIRSLCFVIFSLLIHCFHQSSVISIIIYFYYNQYYTYFIVLFFLFACYLITSSYVTCIQKSQVISKQEQIKLFILYVLFDYHFYQTISIRHVCDTNILQSRLIFLESTMVCPIQCILSLICLIYDD